MKPSRKRKRISTVNDTSKNESTPKRAKTEVPRSTKKRKSQLVSERSPALIANVREIKIILDKSIVDKYFRAKQMLREILSPADPKNLRPKSNKKSKKQASLLDYLQVKNDSLNCSPPHDIENPSDSVIKKEPQEHTADDDHNNDATFDVNMPRIVYYAGSDQSNCLFYNGNLLVMPINAQFTPEEFVYNNCGFVSIMGVPIKTEPPDEESIVIEEHDEMNSVYGHTMSDVMSIDEIATTSTPMIKTSTFVEQKIKSETKQPMAKFDKHSFPVCPKCDRSFKISESFKQHVLLCGLELMFECPYCTYDTKYSHSMKKHVQRIHRTEVRDEGLEEIMKNIRNKRTDKKNLSLMSKEAEHDSEAEGTLIKSIENSKVKHSKLKFDMSCPKCENTFKRVRRLSIKTCPNCAVTLKFKCQKCEKNFSQYDKIYRHVIHCGNDKFTIPQKFSFHCADCTFKTHHKATLRQHIYQQHMKNDKTMYFKCQMCSFESLYEHNFYRHKREVHGVNETIDVDE